eukprot:688516-Heterocapsa_arctica.AAC.1
MAWVPAVPRRGVHGPRWIKGVFAWRRRRHGAHVKNLRGPRSPHYHRRGEEALDLKLGALGRRTAYGTRGPAVEGKRRQEEPRFSSSHRAPLCDDTSPRQDRCHTSSHTSGRRTPSREPDLSPAAHHAMGLQASQEHS